MHDLGREGACHNRYEQHNERRKQILRNGKVQNEIWECECIIDCYGRYKRGHNAVQIPVCNEGNNEYSEYKNRSNMVGQIENILKDQAENK